MKSERGREDKGDHDAWVATVLGASQPTLALGRQTSNCHVGQDWREELISGSSGLLSSGEAGLLGQLSRSLELLFWWEVWRSAWPSMRYPFGYRAWAA